MAECRFNTIRERDMDLLFVERAMTDIDFIRLLVSKTDLKGSEVSIVHAELSRTEYDLGESDITLILKVDDKRYGFLIEDKIDAIAMPEQHSRYIERGKVGIKNKEYLESFGIPVYNLNRKIGDKASFFNTWFALRKLLKKVNPDIVNSHGLYCHNAASFSVLGTGIRHCCTIHNAPEKWGKMTKLINHNTPLIYCSEAALQLRDQNSPLMIAIDNGIDEKTVRCSEVVDLHKELDIPNDDKIIVLVGSTRPQKNYHFLIEYIFRTYLHIFPI